MAHSETISPHDEGNKGQQYTQTLPQPQTPQVQPIMPQSILSSSISSTYSGFPNKVSQVPQAINPHITQAINLQPVSSTHVPPVSGTQTTIPSSSNFPQLPDQTPRFTYTHPQGYPANLPSPNIQPPTTSMYQIRRQDPSQVMMQSNVMLASVPQQGSGSIGEHARPQILQGYLPNQQPVTIFMQTVPLSGQPSAGFTLPKTEDIPKPVNWMANTSIHLGGIPILGTNNSGFFMGEKRAQSVDIAEQLKLGIRFLDMAIVQYHDEIYLDQYEHIFDLKCPYISISEALWSIRFFLERNSKEILYLNLRTAKRVGENSDKIDKDLLEAKFRFIMKFIFNINTVRFNISPGELADSTRKNIICFAENNELFSFLYKHSLSFSASQLELVGFIDYDIEAQMRKSWTRYKKSTNIDIHPQNMHFIWFILDAITPTSDANLLRSIWEEQLKTHVLPPFHFFSLCKVNEHTWERFSPAMLVQSL